MTVQVTMEVGAFYSPKSVACPRSPSLNQPVSIHFFWLLSSLYLSLFACMPGSSRVHKAGMAALHSLLFSATLPHHVECPELVACRWFRCSGSEI